MSERRVGLPTAVIDIIAMAERVNSQWIQGLCGGVPPAESWHENPQFAIYPRSADSVTITLTPDNGVDGTALWVLAADAPNQRKNELQGFIDKAQTRGVDAYLSGEISEPTTHFARETGMHYFACGHHATERYGVQALGQWLNERFGVEHIFIDIDNPA